MQIQSPERFSLPAHPKIIFMGTPEFAVPSLRALSDAEVQLLAVVTQPDRPKGRGRKITPPPVKEFALDKGLKVLQPQNASSAEFVQTIGQMGPDLLVVVAFGQLLKKNLLDVPSWGALNIHASLLPRYRGAAPIQWAILKAETKTGLTAMKMDEGMDTGPIIRQIEVEIDPYESAGNLHDRLSALAGPFLVETIQLMVQGRYGLKEQDPSLATYAPKIDRKMARIDWEQSATLVGAQIRAFDPWPGAFSHIKGKQVKLFKSIGIQDGTSGASPGTILGFDPRGVIVQTGHGALVVGEMQLPGKRRMPVAEVIKGFRISPGERFEP